MIYIKNFIYIFVGLSFLFISCNDVEREKQLTERENFILEKEKQFAQKEAEYQLLLKMRDSLMTIKDTTITNNQWPENFKGIWNSKVICIESNCSDYVIGDVRTDQWEFDNSTSQLIVKTISNKKLTRVYNATYSNNQISLSFTTDSLADKIVDMNVTLNELSTDKIKGVRTVSIDNKCTAKFSVELVKNKNNF